MEPPFVQLIAYASQVRIPPRSDPHFFSIRKFLLARLCACFLSPRRILSDTACMKQP
jgi:hypothetical protein